MVPVLVIRPEPGCAATAAAARALGLETHAAPLFDIRPRPWAPPGPGEFDAVLLGSANAVRHAGPGLAALTGLPAYAVGEATASAARAAGFAEVIAGSGGLQPLIATLDPRHRRLLRLAGDERVPLALPSGVWMAERVVYANHPLPMPPALSAVLVRPAIVLLHSGLAASHFASECVAHGIVRARHRLAVLAPRIAAVAGGGWGEVAVAAAPGDAALLALARQMCQDPWPGA